MKRIALVAAVSLLAATTLLAEATVEQKTKVRMGGALGGIFHAVGGKAAREGMVSTHTIKGDRRLVKSGTTGELVDLNEEKVYQIDFGRSSYKVVTFAQMRKQMEDMKKQAEKSAQESRSSDSTEKMPEFDVVVDVNQTGERETINGYNARRTLMTITVTEKGKKLDNGGAVLTADMWMTPKVAAIREMSDFEQRYIKKVYGGLVGQGDMRQMAMLMASSPQFSKAMKKLEEKKGTLDGTSVRTEIRFETVAGPNQPKESASAGDPSADAIKAVVGGIFGKMSKKRTREAEADSKSSDPNRNLLFGSNTDVLRAESSAASADLAIPTGFKLKS
ncbi:MAG TPA: hypothetical protein VNM92_02715 [Thermoanaerobaculia bacterium]|nr:hypothetical protein [Thermoanaerobaculia bacterium]